jgi:histidinol-phosphate aminotransferase
MATSMNRRNWLKTSALVTTGALTLPDGIFNTASAAPLVAPRSTSQLSMEQRVAQDFPPNLKARLFANENPFGPSEKAKKAMADAMATSYQYPIQVVEQLIGKIAAAENIKPEQIMVGTGSTPLLQASAIFFAKNGGSIVCADPAYEYLPEEAEKNFGAKWVKVPLTADYKYDLDAMEKAIDKDTKLVYICNPNNPTGTYVDAEKMRAFCERVSPKVPVIIDEAYINYLSDPKGMTLIDCVRKGQNVIVARTFSKLHALAGMRVGYFVAQPEMLKNLLPYTVPFGALSALSASAALATYDDTEYLQGALKKTLESKEYLYNVLKKEGYTYIPSVTNFVMFPINMEGQRFVDEMMKRGVGLRFWKFNNKEWCRISIGRMDEMKFFEEAFKQLS